MDCYRLTSDKIQEGIPPSFSVENAKVRHGLIRSAAVSLVVPACLARRECHAETRRGPLGYQFGEAWLRRPRQASSAGCCLLMLDWLDWWPDRNLGDLSILVDWRRTLALYRCQAGAAFMRRRRDGAVAAVNPEGRPTLLPAADYRQLRTTHEHRQAVARLTGGDNSLIDYVLE